MTTTSIEERKRNISEIKASFPNPAVSGKYRDLGENTTKTEADTVIHFPKIRIFIAVLIFAAFVYCDQTQGKISGYTTKEIIEQIEKTIPLEKMLESITSVLSH